MNGNREVCDRAIQSLFSTLYLVRPVMNSRQILDNGLYICIYIKSMLDQSVRLLLILG